MTRNASSGTTRPSGAAYWVTLALGTLIALMGLVLAAGGLWLIVLGGSWYYALAGVGLAIAGVLVARLSMLGFWLFLAVYLATWVWALWEVGADPWPLIPRVVAPTILFLLVAATIPVLRRRRPGDRPDGRRTAARAAVVLIAGALALPSTDLSAQEAPAPLPAPEPEEQDRAQEEAAEPEIEAEDITAPTQVAAVPPSAPRETMEMPETGLDWPAYGGTYHALRYSPARCPRRGTAATAPMPRKPPLWWSRGGCSFAPR